MRSFFIALVMILSLQSWVKAHSTDKLNNEVDLLAKDASNL